MRRFLFLIFLAAGACTGSEPLRAVDGGGFRLPDAAPRDGGVRDSGIDAGPFVCDPACANGQVCGCIANDCGCRAPSMLGDPCDPQHPETCGAGSCVRARFMGSDIFFCSDGREGFPCSKTADICTTALGCVCYTPSSGATDCLCLEQHDPMNELCDRMVPETCPGGVCVRVEASSGGVYFLCSDGAEGRPCEVGDNSCRTSLGCTCPRIQGRDRCRCSEPAGDGEPCDINVAGSCVPPLMCYPTQLPNQGVSTTCSDGPQGGRDGGVGTPGGCDPNDPMSCPPGQVCIPTGQGFQCV